MKFQEYFKKVHSYGLRIDFIIRSLGYLKNEVLIPSDVEDNVFNFIPLFYNDVDNGLFINFHRFKKTDVDKRIIGIDSSVVPIAESKDGFVLGLKGSVVIESNRSYEVMSIGPVPIYISPKTVKIITEVFGYSISHVKRDFLDLEYTKRLAINIFETGLIANALESYENSIVLIDGSLGGPFKECKERFSYLYHLAKLGGNSIVGISKKSKFMKKYPYFYKMVLSHSVPGAVEIPWTIIKRTLPYRVFISIFRVSGLPFRVDIPGKEDYIDVLNQVYSSTITPVGYPEVLKESHILSQISRFEVMLLRRYLEVKGAYFVSTEKLRDMIFGAFNNSSSV